MTFQPKTLEDISLNRLFTILLKGLKENAGLDEKRQIVNSILPVHKYTLLQWFLFKDEDILLNCLSIFLDERTKFLDFGGIINNQQIIKSILEMIPKHCPNVETIDFTRLCIRHENKETFKTFLKQTAQLKSLRVGCEYANCTIYDLLLEKYFEQHDQEVQNGLLKIDYIDGLYLHVSQCAKLLNLLPNLQSLGIRTDLGPVLFYYFEKYNNPNRLLNIIEFLDVKTSLYILEIFVKYCPKTKKIVLWDPLIYVLENLWKFPLLTEIGLVLKNVVQVRELMNLLTRKIAQQIKILYLIIDCDFKLDPNTIHALCPELLCLYYNDQIFNFD